jgi:hypothetical protein
MEKVENKKAAQPETLVERLKRKATEAGVEVVEEFPTPGTGYVITGIMGRPKKDADKEQK